MESSAAWAVRGKGRNMTRADSSSGRAVAVAACGSDADTDTEPEMLRVPAAAQRAKIPLNEASARRSEARPTRAEIRMVQPRVKPERGGGDQWGWLSRVT